MSPEPQRTITFITSNANKLREVASILSSEEEVDDAAEAEPTLGLELRSQSVDLPEIQGSVEEVARDKCQRAAAVVPGPVLTEDTALEFTALGGLPGVYIKYFLSTLGHAGLNKLLAGFDDKSGTAVCTFAYAESAEVEPRLFQGRTEGRIVDARGGGNFGWDAVFEYQGKTFAEMEPAEKNAISHRFKALQKLRAFLQEDARKTEP